ncbi:MAG: AsmA family protein, partial [Elusimicrobia bacterium]|nr:AsmA family protein [Elusimicrobiota bacterium]
MKKLSTYLWRAFLAAVALFLVALVSAPFILGRLFPPAKIRALVAQQAKQNLGRDVKIGGVGWSLIHGVTITDFAISERPDFSAGAFAAFDSLSVRVKLWPLLHRRLVVASLEAKNPQVSVVQHKDGTFNFSDMLSSPAQKTAAPAGKGAPAAQPFSYAAGKIEISGGHVIYRDEAAGREVEVSNLDADIRHFRIAGPVEASVSAALSVKQGGQARNGTFSYDGAVDLGGGDPARMDFKFHKMAAAFMGWSARLSGGVKNLQSPKFDLQAQVSRGGTELAAGRVSGDAALTKTYGLKSVQASLDLKTPGFKASDAGLSGAAAGLAVPPLSLTGQASFADGRLGLKGVSVVSAQLGSVNVDGSLAGFGAREWNPDLALSAHLNVPQLAASQIPFLPASVPASLIVPQAVLDLKAAVSGAQAKISTLDVKTEYGVVSVAGTVGNLWRAPAPNLSVSAKLNIPKLRADELPFLDAPQGFV